ADLDEAERELRALRVVQANVPALLRGLVDLAAARAARTASDATRAIELRARAERRLADPKPAAHQVVEEILLARRLLTSAPARDAEHADAPSAERAPAALVVDARGDWFELPNE